MTAFGITRFNHTQARLRKTGGLIATKVLVFLLLWGVSAKPWTYSPSEIIELAGLTWAYCAVIPAFYRRARLCRWC